MLGPTHAEQVARRSAALGLEFEVRTRPRGGWRRAWVREPGGAWRELRWPEWGGRLPAQRLDARLNELAADALWDWLALGVSRAFLRVGDEGSHQERLARMTDRERAIVAEFLAGCGVPR